MLMNALLTEATPYFGGSENIPSRPIPAVILVGQRSLNTSSLEEGVASAHCHYVDKQTLG